MLIDFAFLAYVSLAISTLSMTVDRASFASTHTNNTFVAFSFFGPFGGDCDVFLPWFLLLHDSG